jgi:hypothetical protein
MSMCRCVCMCGLSRLEVAFKKDELFRDLGSLTCHILGRVSIKTFHLSVHAIRNAHQGSQGIHCSMYSTSKPQRVGGWLAKRSCWCPTPAT